MKQACFSTSLVTLSAIVLLTQAACGGGEATSEATASGSETSESTTDTSGAETDSNSNSNTDPTGDPAGTDSGSSETGSETDPTTEGPTDSETGPTTSDTDPTDPTETSASDTEDDQCMGGSLCGEPAVCCPAGNECVEDACLPICESEVRCGPDLELCCDSGDVCLADTCVTPGQACEDSYDCEPGEFCEPTLDQCVPQPDPLTCEYVPSFEELDVTVEWEWTEQQIISPAVVGDITGDGLPEVVVNATRVQGGSWPSGMIVALDGQTGTKLWELPHDPNNGVYGSHGRSSIALGDVDGDGISDVVYAGRASGGRSPVHAVNGDGQLLWTSHNGNNQTATTPIENGGASLVNFDDDPEAEVVFGAAVFDNDGLMVWDQGGSGGSYGTSNGYTGGISAVADLDGDQVPEIVSGRHAWKVNWTPGNPPTVSLSLFWESTEGPDGYPAIADLDLNGTPEVAIIGSGSLRIVDGATGDLWCGIDESGVACNGNDNLRTQPRALTGGGRGGPPTISDFDGDGRPEVGIAGASRYIVFDFNREGENIVKPNNEPDPAPGAIYVRWLSTTQDQSSNATGSSVFDFQGDGAAEVVYADECFLRVYSGTDGTVQLELQNSSATIHEYPLVVDVDADGNSEIIAVANQFASCNTPGYTPRQGVFAYGDAGNGWVPTRRVWTSHAYHVTNATSAANVPFLEDDNWTTEGLNNYRQNVEMLKIA